MFGRLQRRAELLWFGKRLDATRELRPLDTEAGRSDIGIGFLTCSRHVKMMIVAARSFYHFSGIVCPLYVWDDGSLTVKDTSSIQRVFPAARILRRSELDHSPLKDFPLTRAFAQQKLERYESYAPSLKLFGPLLSPGVPNRFILADSDAFFFDWPRVVVEWIDEPGVPSRYLQPVSGHDNVPEAELSELYARVGIRSCPRINSGLLLLERDVFRLDVVEEILRWYETKAYAWDIEQTIYRLLMASSASEGLDQDDYVLCLRKYSAVCHHFFTSVIEDSRVVQDKIVNLLHYMLECQRLNKPPIVIGRARERRSCAPAIDP